MNKINWPDLKNRKLKPSRFSINDYEVKMLGKTLISRKKKEDRGETDNFLLSVDLIHHSHTKGLVVFLTDDQKAVGGFLNDWLPAFPTIKLWSSYEVILFLYAEKIIPSKDIAVELIKEVIAFSAPKPAERSVDTAQKLLSILRFYNKKIELVSQIIH
ncbi:hypothetical protein [Pedobacter sp. D749]|uniref:hypothetical protein n=1 Tax=Pedobacter sp. D749 TaxID=2856523 RepID=UPI001C56D9E9|nr:hypothetical protein [Pedobacter sp. D749]QXU41463.1 hypothetical protein KYH19_21065 [Pedobacter sp. D749]